MDLKQDRKCNQNTLDHANGICGCFIGGAAKLRAELCPELEEYKGMVRFQQDKIEKYEKQVFDLTMEIQELKRQQSEHHLYIGTSMRSEELHRIQITQLLQKQDTLAAVNTRYFKENQALKQELDQLKKKYDCY